MLSLVECLHDLLVLILMDSQSFKDLNFFLIGKCRISVIPTTHAFLPKHCMSPKKDPDPGGPSP